MFTSLKNQAMRFRDRPTLPLIAWLFFCSLPAPIHAQQQPPPAPTPDILISTGTTVTPREPQRAEFQTPLANNDSVPALAFEARAHHAGGTPATAGYLLKIRLNGREVAAAENRLQPLLRNKPPTEQGEAWHRSLVGWRVPYATEFPQPPEERFSTVVEVGPLLQPAGNLLEFSILPQADSQSQVILRNVRLIHVPRRPPAEHFEFPPDLPTELQSNPAGEIAIRQAGLDYGLTASVGNPGGGWLQRGPPLPDWKATIVIPQSADEGRVIETDRLRWTRRLHQIAPDHLLVEEQLSNLTDQETGTRFQIDLPFPRPVANISLGGDHDPSLLQNHSAANPTIFVPLNTSSIGLVAEDDLLRSQAVMACRNDSGAVSLRAERLYLPPRATLTLRWSVYLLPGNDYFHFINRLRDDWGVRLRIPGPLWWNAYSRVGKTDRELQRFLARQTPFAAVIGSWVDHQKRETPQTVGLGTGVNAPDFADYRARLKRFTQRLKRLDPQLKVLVYNHYFFNWPETDPDEFRDSWILRENGERYLEPATAAESPAAGLYPTEFNSFGKAFQQTLLRERRELGIDGFYLDETTSPGRLRDPITFGEADGVTAILDPETFAVRHRVGALSLLTAPYLSRLSRQLLEARLIVVGNYPPVTAEQNRMNWPRFVETDNLRHCSSAQLYSPLAFSYRFEQYTIQDVRDRLDQGLVWCVTGPEDRIGIVRHFFPLTPVRLHAGWIEARERIIVTTSGRYGWEGEPSEARLWIYDSAGKLLEAEPQWNVIQSLTPVEVPPGGIAILERNLDHR